MGERRPRPAPELREVVAIRDLFDNHPLSMWIYDVATLRFLDVNRTAQRRYGYSRAEFLKLTVEDLREPVGHSDSIEHMIASHGHAGPATVRVRHRKRDGSNCDVELHVHGVFMDRRPARLVTVRDFTRRDEARRRRQVHELLLGTLDDAVIVTDDELRVLGWHGGAEAVYGWSAAEALGQPAPELLGEEGGGVARRRLLAAGRFRGEVQHRRKDGTPLRVMVRAAALAPGAPSGGFLSVNRDVTQKRRGEMLVRALLHKVVAAQEEERRRVSRELHDDAAQLVTSLQMGLRGVEDAGTLFDACAAAAGMRVHLARAVEGLDRIARGLRPAVLDALGLVEALARLATDLRAEQGLAVDIAVHGVRRLPAPIETTLYRIAQEAIANAVKHGGATAISIVLSRKEATVQLIVEDDGRGFDSATLLSTERLGLLGMRERAALLGGAVVVESMPGRGTTVQVTIPLGVEP